MNKKYIISSIVVIIILIAVFISFSNPLRKSETDIQLWLQEKTPIGMTFVETKKLIENEGWYNPKSQGSDGNTPERYLRGYLGRYWSIPFFTYVTVFWEFDQNQNLINIRVLKSTDAL